jgi:hypothetical protein
VLEKPDELSHSSLSFHLVSMAPLAQPILRQFGGDSPLVSAVAFGLMRMTDENEHNVAVWFGFC